MRRTSLLMVCIAGLIGGCQSPQMAMEPPKKPSPPPEMAKLARLVGNWTGTAEMVEPSPEDMKAAAPEGAEEMPSSYASGGKMEWALDGMFLRGDGWYEMGPDEKAQYIEYWTWDPKAKRYRIWSASDWGEAGTGWAEFDPDDPNTMRYKSTMYDAEGNKKHGHGTMTFVGDNRMEWTYTEKGPMGKMKLKGASTRQP